MNKIEIINMDPKLLTAYENNAKEHDDKQIKNISNSIKKYGFKQPVLIDSDNMIIAGHGRVLGALKLKLNTVPCLVAYDLTDEQIREYRILDNKLNESYWINDILKFEIEDLDFSDFELDFDFGEETEDLETEEDDFDVEEVLNEIEEPTAKLGDIWQLGRHKLMCGDSTSIIDIDKLMSGALADLVVTDPPYNVDYDNVEKARERVMEFSFVSGKRQRNVKNARLELGHLTGIVNDKKSDEDFYNFLDDAFNVMSNSLKQGGALYIFHAGSEAVNFITAFKQYFMFKQTLIWVKNNFALGLSDYHYKHEPCLYGWKDGDKHYFTDNRTQTTVFEDKIDLKKLKKDEMLKMLEQIYSDKASTTIISGHNPQNHSDLHPTMKPIKLLATLIKNSSRENEIVLDTFGGSGSTLIACEQLNRTCYMCELEPKYVDVIIRRWEQFTGQQAVLINDTD